jgi:hypothetical protein
VTRLDDERPTPRARLVIKGEQAWIEIQFDDQDDKGVTLPAEFAMDVAKAISAAYADLTAASN